MPKMNTYHSKDSVKARKVTGKDGEDIVTDRGPVHAEKGSYVVQREETSTDPISGEKSTRLYTTVQDAETFEAAYKAAPTRKSTPSKPSQPRTGSSSGKVGDSAADRVKASAAGKSADK